MKSSEIVRISERGQIYIPKSYRNALGMKKNSKVAISIEKQKLIINVLPEDPLDAACGFLAGKRKLHHQLIQDRRAEKAAER